MNKRRAGTLGEELACAYLQNHGFKILERNYSRPTGEIDIIAREGETIAFVEVKARASMRYGTPAEAVNRAKQAHILRTALLYAAEQRLDDVPMRFDIIEVLPENIRLIRAAFDGSDLM